MTIRYEFRLNLKFNIFILCGWLICNTGYSQIKTNVDSIKIYSIPEIVVTEQFRNAEIRSSAPLQILSSKNIEELNILQVSDAVKFFSGVTVKDYGGIGGLKTISVRSLGANHTAVSYDGITLTDCQTGQIDLGRFSLENVDILSLNNGQSDNIFQPARLFASASVLSIQTERPHFKVNKTINGKVAMKVGAFGLMNPTLWLNGKINSKISVSLSSEWLSANGEYPYILYYSSTPNGLSSSEIRQNTDVKNLRLEGTLYGNFSANENGYVKTYIYQSERGLPGATIFYNAENSSKQRIWDNTFFAQAHYQKEFSKLLVFQTNAKYNRGYMRYLDPTYLNSDEKLENTYIQQEYYGSLSLLYRAFENISFSTSTDGAVNKLDADLSGFPFPTRYTILTSLAAKYVTNLVLVTGSLLGTFVNETVKIGIPGDDQTRLSPFMSLSIKPFISEDFRVRAFYKNIFRMPSFNDLYYTQAGSRTLKPEKTNQYNFGMTYSTSFGKWLPLLTLTVDGYHNDVADKIVAYPNKSTFFWSILNLGKVAVDGLDLTAETTFLPFDKIGVLLGTTYTYQRALNVTDPSDGVYGQQLPYTPRISGSAKAAIQTPWINISYSVIWSGSRYAVNQNYAENRLPGYSDHSISVNRSFNFKQNLLSANLEVLNLMDENYSIVRYFPMPGRSFRATVSLKF